MAFFDALTGAQISVRNFVASVSPQNEPLPQFSFSYDKKTKTLSIVAGANSYIIYNVIRKRT